jgi:hydrogenase expression/formation protein HypC
MCLPRIDRIISIDGDEAVTEHGGSSPISLLCVPQASIGDHVMIHAGHAIQILDPEEAAERQSMIASIRGEGLSPLTSLAGETDNGGGHDPGSLVL